MNQKFSLVIWLWIRDSTLLYDCDFRNSTWLYDCESEIQLGNKIVNQRFNLVIWLWIWDSTWLYDCESEIQLGYMIVNQRFNLVTRFWIRNLTLRMKGYLIEITIIDPLKIIFVFYFNFLKLLFKGGWWEIACITTLQGTEILYI